MNKKLIIVFSILALVIIAFTLNYLFSSSIKLNPPIFTVDSPQQQGVKISTEQECKSLRGQWRWDNCVLPASDVGKKCRDNSECQAACIAELTPQENRLLIDEYGKHTFEKMGHCGEFAFGCYAHVNNGKVKEILCAD